MCVHGTYLKILESIEKIGLSCMKRNHVHFARCLSRENGVLSGMCGDCEVLIYLDV
jgi:2'-phosphotransferase